MVWSRCYRRVKPRSDRFRWGGRRAIRHSEREGALTGVRPDLRFGLLDRLRVPRPVRLSTRDAAAPSRANVLFRLATRLGLGVTMLGSFQSNGRGSARRYELCEPL